MRLDGNKQLQGARLVCERDRRRSGRPEPGLGCRRRSFPLRRRRSELGDGFSLVVDGGAAQPTGLRPWRPARPCLFTRPTTAPRSERSSLATMAGSSGRTTPGSRLRREIRLLVTRWTTSYVGRAQQRLPHHAVLRWCLLPERDALLRRSAGQRDDPWQHSNWTRRVARDLRGRRRFAGGRSHEHADSVCRDAK